MKVFAIALLICCASATNLQDVAEDQQCGQFAWNNTIVRDSLTKAMLNMPSLPTTGDDDKCCACVKSWVDRILGYVRNHVKEEYCSKLPPAKQEICNQCIDKNLTVQGFFIGYYRLFAQGANYCIGKGDCSANMTVTESLLNSQDRLALFTDKSHRTWEQHNNTYLYGYAIDDAHYSFGTLEEAQNKCEALGDELCGGITLRAGVFELRRGKQRPGHQKRLLHSPFNETSWVKSDANSVASFAAAQLHMGTLLEARHGARTTLPASALGSSSALNSVATPAAPKPPPTAWHGSHGFVRIYMTWRRHVQQSVHNEQSSQEKCACAACQHMVNVHVVSASLQSWKDYCGSTKCPFFQSVCKWGESNPQQLVGYVIGYVEPWKYSQSYCYGKGVCPHPHSMLLH